LNNSSLNSNNPEGGTKKTAFAPRWTVHPTYCPGCGKGQPVSECCVSCGIPFSSFAADESDADPSNELKAEGVTVGELGSYSLSSLIEAFPLILGRIAQRRRIIALFLLFVSIVSLVAVIAQYRSHMQGQYLQNYVLAIYGIKSGMEMAGRVCEGKYRAWKEGVPSDAPKSGAIDPRTLADMKSVKAEIDGIMGKVVDPPNEYNQASLRLQNLYAIYNRINTLIINSPGSLSLQRSEMVAAKEGFSREIKNLKGEMPAPLADEFIKAGKKYDLRFLGL
jgi:hypothetical protein